MKNITLLMTLLLINPVVTAAAPNISNTPALNAKPLSSQCFKAEVSGQGKPILLIPGFSNDRRVWEAQQNTLSKQYQIHTISIAGFAGQTPCNYKDGFLNTLTNQLLAYIKDNNLNDVSVAGHSLGGLLAMKLAIKKPQLFSNIISVDGLPFIGTIFTRNNNTKVSDIRFQAQQMQKMYHQASPNQIEFMTQQSMAIQTDYLAGQQAILTMAKSSDPATLGDSLFDVMSTDLRPELHKITSKFLLIGASGGFSTQAEHQFVKALYQAQLADKVDAVLLMNTKAKHFVMYDDSDWLTQTMNHFISKDNNLGVSTYNTVDLDKGEQ